VVQFTPDAPRVGCGVAGKVPRRTRRSGLEYDSVSNQRTQMQADGLPRYPQMPGQFRARSGTVLLDEQANGLTGRVSSVHIANCKVFRKIKK
jgi:hypothetical protein